MFKNIRHVHFIGIGGIGMSSIASILNGMGYVVSGSDIRPSSITDNLQSLGITIFNGHKAENVNDADIVVYTSAVKDDNAEMIEAERLHIPVIPRAEMLAELMRMKYSVAVSGTHGKTTTTSMLAKILSYAQLDPTMIVGGIVKSMDNNNAKLGKGKFLIAEADESDKSFLRLFPNIIIITNIDEDHMDNYNDIDDIIDHFSQFTKTIPFNGSIIAWGDDENTVKAINGADRRIISYGFNPKNQVIAANISLKPMSSEYDFICNDMPLGRISINVPGQHNILNSLGAVCAAMEIGIDFDSIKEGIEQFDGVRRRFDIIHADNKHNIFVIDDYAHHPNEIFTVIKSAKNMGKFNIVSVFQPHLYSRTVKFMDQFASSLLPSDRIIITDIYPAREKPVPGINGQLLADKLIEMGHNKTDYVKDKAHIAQHLISALNDNTIYLFIGAGDINKFSAQFAERIAR